MFLNTNAVSPPPSLHAAGVGGLLSERVPTNHGGPLSWVNHVSGGVLWQPRKKRYKMCKLGVANKRVAGCLILMSGADVQRQMSIFCHNFSSACLPEATQVISTFPIIKTIEVQNDDVAVAGISDLQCLRMPFAAFCPRSCSLWQMVLLQTCARLPETFCPETTSKSWHPLLQQIPVPLKNEPPLICFPPSCLRGYLVVHDVPAQC